MAERIQPLPAAVERQRQLLEEWRRAAGPAAAPDERAADSAPTPRETAVLLLLTEALTAEAVGRRLGRSVRTVHQHVENVHRKLGTRDRVGTVLRAQRLGLVPSPARSGPAGTARARTSCCAARPTARPRLSRGSSAVPGGRDCPCWCPPGTPTARCPAPAGRR
ncbi:LuxR C-terminal-related transcriptional regulator [Streptomyces sp. NPDC006193]|uniref:response regulator transcription factor n=1 Tax=Streptomyces sp. NPDC006193 TaxID=3155717 RepID=UPI0033AAEDB1